MPFPPERKAIDIGDVYSRLRQDPGDAGLGAARPLREGLARTIDFYRANWRQYW